MEQDIAKIYEKLVILETEMAEAAAEAVRMSNAAAESAHNARKKTS